MIILIVITGLELFPVCGLEPDPVLLQLQLGGSVGLMGRLQQSFNVNYLSLFGSFSACFLSNPPPTGHRRNVETDLAPRRQPSHHKTVKILDNVETHSEGVV